MSNTSPKHGAVESYGVFSVLEDPVYTPRKLRVICVGAGISGMTLAFVLKQRSMESYVDLCIYEKSHDVGGTWLENIYPGVSL